MISSIHCPGCGSAALSASLRIEAQPVILNYRFRTAEESAAVPLRPIALTQCGNCGLVFNSAFEEGVVPYDEFYENRQSHSAAFAKHTTQIARIIGAMMESDAPRILEVGCGKGEFLRRVVSFCAGTGEGWDTSYEGPNTVEGVTFHKEYLTPEATQRTFDAVVCRHVVEHVPPIGAFLRDLNAIARAAGQPFVFIETPRLEWILENKSAWDIFYEHCNYFTEPALAALCRNAGFKVLGQYPVFARQYQFLILAVDRDPTIATREPSATRPEAIDLLREIQDVVFPKLARLIDDARNGFPWAIWGAGAKGVCLANRLPNASLVRVIDTNTAKQGFFIPGTHIPIVAPSADHFRDLGLVVIANPTYESEIHRDLEVAGFSGKVLVLNESLL